MSTVKANTYLAASGSPTEEPSIPALDQRMAKAWIQWVGTTNAIADSYNVSSITDGGTGFYTINYQTNMPNDNYAYTLGSTDISSQWGVAYGYPYANQLQVFTRYNASLYEWGWQTAIVFGN